MTEPWSDARLELVLVSVGAHLDTDPASATVPTADQPRSRRWLAIAAAIVALLVGATLAITPVREAVADFLGIGSTTVEVVPESEADPAGLPTIDAGPIGLAQRCSRDVGEGLPEP